MDRRHELPAAWPAGAPPDYNVGVYNTVVPPVSAVASGGYERHLPNPPQASPPQQQPLPQPPMQLPVQLPPQVSKLPTKNPGYIWCSHCNKTVISDVKYKRGSFSWIVCGLMALFLLWPCFLFALCLKTCKDVEHTCPSCQRVLHLYKRP
ncbi:lipopolysaccharide-induced tumor necrosis factor-alpha factor homolog [Synchiropus splendidus]|uniref:lipopolysaccharide-induced tumor necrosis factor-alpha factor homolog n=1 Tax=Synchiropus splendidus TaxID=270530 RepID=UPI00237E900F|nr:lipopolysaccharide-induced tumor necrosis factor-alpha factor homolog [Synchiropus splendidus]XP_053712680.1 lipopolysaccharide-induced tumor necrosis factor-alpha factor homolog [Synchiropus splendidus]